MLSGFFSAHVQETLHYTFGPESENQKNALFWLDFIAHAQKQPNRGGLRS